jgi:4-amino-4-deoxy-L-arabinose transferase-like glycosyltransferase
MKLSLLRSSRFQNWCLLLLIGVIAFAIRWIDIDSLPRGLNWDETAYAYNSFSLLKTGRDQWGQFLPLFMKSFGEYKPALLSYLMMPALLIAPGSAVAVRSVNVLLGTMAVLASCGLIWQLTKKRELAFLTAFFLAVTPWHIHFSRTTLDTGLSHALLIIGLWLILEKRVWQWWAGVFFLFLSMYAYSAERIFIPAIILAMVWWWNRQNPTLWRERLVPLMVLGVFIIGWIFFTLFGVAGVRARSIFSLNASGIEPVSQFFRQYSLYWRPDFLFFKEGSIKASPLVGFPSRGNLLEVMAPLILFGFFVSISRRNNTDKFLWIWLLLAPIPGALTDDSPHPSRALIMLPILNYFAALGLVWLAEQISSRRSYLYSLVLGIGILVVSAGALSWWSDYQRYYPEQSEGSWQGEFKDIGHWLAANRGNQSIYFTRRVDTHALLFLAWYAQINPELVQKGQYIGNPDSHLESFGQFHLIEDSQSALGCDLLKPASWAVLSLEESQPLKTSPLKEFRYYHENGLGGISFRVFATEDLLPIDRAWAQEVCII